MSKNPFYKTNFQSYWLVLHEEHWIQVSSSELIHGFEEGLYQADQQIRASHIATPKPLRKVIRELVWSSQQEQSEVTHSSQYFELVDHAPIPTALSDLGGRITYVNQAFCDFLDYPREEVIGLTVGALSHPDDHKAEVTRGNRLISKGQGGFKMEKRYLSKTGDLRVGLLSISMLHTEDGQPYAVLAQISDLTERKEMELHLARSRTLSALGEMAQRVTHDLKNILMVLRGTLDLIQIQQDRLDPEDLALIEEGIVVCDSGDRLVRSLLDFKLSEEPRCEVLNLSSLLKNIESTLRRSIAPISLSLVIHDTCHEILLWGQSLWIERILLNLSVNARQAIEATTRPLEKESVKIILRPMSETEQQSYQISSEAITLEVKDCGIGIPAEMKDKILEPYMTTRLDQGGHGLGLSTVWSLCEQLGGLLHIETELGIGSSFCLILPIYKPKDDDVVLNQSISR